ncbi:hypothetical protein JYT83_00650 [bacterium AH-315-F18]|nr:hypothetical protein [bacterium AH-315-F18]
MAIKTLRSALCLLLIFLVGCDNYANGGWHTITEVRALGKPVAATGKAMSDATRFGWKASGGGAGHQHEAEQRVRLVWTLPTGWKKKASTPMRRANFGVEGRPELQCYLTVLPGAAGGLKANADRWRSQMGLPPYTADEMNALGKAKLLNQEAVVIDLKGSFSGMGKGAVRPDYAMVGLIVAREGEMLFIKLVGPAADVAAERAHFDALWASMALTGGGAGQQHDDHDDHAGHNHASEQTSGAGGLHWTRPKQWVRGPARNMRLVTFVPEGSKGTEGVECYITSLPGTAGGVKANINRWLGQMGRPELGPGGLELLATVNVLGEAAPLVDATGAFTGMDGKTAKKDHGLLGVIRVLPSRVLFIKMTGPAQAVAAQRKTFVAFCESLTLDGGQ